MYQIGGCEMNKKELIERLKENGAWCTEIHTGEKDFYVKISKARELIKELDEPEEECLNVPDNIKQMRELYADLLQTFIEKNSDYGNSFDQSIDEFGLIAGVVRMADKLNRLKTLINKPRSEVDESLRDTALDLANYAAMFARKLSETE